jgi:Phosphodiester glycosidase
MNDLSKWRRAVMAPSKHRSVRLALAVALMAFTGADSAYWERCTPQPRKIFSGVTYGCERLERTEQGYGVLHWVRVELDAPGIELYVSPLDRSALEQGWQYRLRWIEDVVTDDHLAVAINGTLFTSKSTWRPRLPGDLANGVETVVSDHIASHFWEHTYLLWFDDDLNPHLRPSKPPKAAELRQAKWGIGGQGVWLYDGKVWSGSDRQPDARTAIGIDAERKLLFLAVAEWASPRLVLERLAELGARDAMLLDGGGSSAMAIGEGARGVARGPLLGGWRPVATFFGVRARQLSAAQGG